MVERTAHNGFVVGSSPTKLSKMKFELKNYRYFKAGKLLKSNKYVFMYFCPNLNNFDWTKIEQKFSKNGMTYYRVYNTITKRKLGKSIFKHNSFLINGPIIFIFLKENQDASMKQLLEFSEKMSLLAIKVKNKFYVKGQVDRIGSLKSPVKYTTTLNSLKFPFYKFYNLLYRYKTSKT